MGAVAQSLPVSRSPFGWLWEFLRDELTPYRGRTALVVRMVAASTLVMIICMTFKIPYAGYAAIYALTTSRESLESTREAVWTAAIGLVLAGAYAVAGAMLVLGDPILRFLWVIVTLFLIFYAISAMNNYAAAARFGYLIVVTIPLWDRHIPADQKVEGTLWAVGAITLGSVITLLLEMLFAAFRRTDDLTEGIAERLHCVEELLGCYADDRPVTAATQSSVTRLAMVGASRLRQMLQRSNYAPQYAQQLGAVVALVARLVDIAANLSQLNNRVPEADRQRVRRVAQGIAAIRADLTNGNVPCRIELPADSEAPPTLPLLRELERTAYLIPEACVASDSLSVYAPPPPGSRARTIPIARGAFSNYEHVKFGLRGCLAASFCYVVYNSLFWPGISTAVTTCLLTALTTVGASHQKQFLRFAGALVGGFGIGMGAQIFILPNIDSIGGFTVLFAVVAVISSWFATSSSRLSYFGVQVLVAFCLINLLEFKIQTSLAEARDRVVGILLGLFAMWLAYDQLWSAPAGVEMKKAFISNLRLLAQFAREPISTDIQVASERSYTLRATINAQFDKVRSLADGVLFEFGSSRRQDLALRDRIRRWQPQLRTLFVMRIGSLKYRLQLPGFELPESIRLALQEYDSRSAEVLEVMADRIDGKTPGAGPNSDDPFKALEQQLPAQISAANLQSFVTLVRGIDALMASLAEEIATEFG